MKLHGIFYLFVRALSLSTSSVRVDRRGAIVTVIGSTASVTFPKLSTAEEEDLRSRDRKGNKDAIIRDDYWYISGKPPPRLLGGPLKGDDPEYNAFGSCSTTPTADGGTTNSCTYVSLKQRIPAYSKYASSIAFGARQYQQLRSLLLRPNESSWQQAAALVQRQSPPPPILDAELKMVLLATALLTSPNFPGPSKELLVSRYYVNEVHFCHGEIREAIAERNAVRAIAAWEYGRDSWNSYFQTIDRQIVPKVGDKFVPIE